MIKPEGPNVLQLEIRQLRVIPEIILGPADFFFQDARVCPAAAGQLTKINKIGR